MNAQGQPQHQDDIRSQLALALDNLESVLAGAEMGLANLTRIVVYTTDIEAVMKHLDLYGQRLGRVGSMPPMTMIEVARLALPTLMIEIEASAAD